MFALPIFAVSGSDACATTQEKTRLQRLVSRLSDSLGRLFDKLQNIAMGRGTVLDYVKPEAQAVVDDLNELDNEEYEL